MCLVISGILFYLLGAVLMYGWEVAFVIHKYSILGERELEAIRWKAVLLGLWSWFAIFLSVLCTALARMFSDNKKIDYVWTFGWSK